ncbi:MAG TPA: helix-turn-helix domain-containing protein [Solirubrobacteraceae bacterium]|nr:helix-turn-helix domain-containing protein [Solirubrobacteraceae bacterium]
MDRLDAPRHTVSLLDADPDLGDAIPAAEFEEARRRAVAQIVEVDGPRWNPHGVCASAGPGWVGLFVVDGLIVRRVSVAGRMACEIFGLGDLTRPWDEDGEYAPLVIDVDWLVLKPTQLALLDRNFALRIARWPSISAKLMQRVAGRARHLALTQAVTHLPRTHARLLLLFWLLAERWGSVTPEGVVVKLPLTHQVLAMLVGSHRPTVTIALQKLSRADLLLRESSQRWLLTNRAITHLQEPDSLSLIGGEEDVDEAAAEAQADAAGPGDDELGDLEEAEIGDIGG